MLLKGSLNGATKPDEEHYLQSIPVKIKNQESITANVKPYFTDFIKEENGGQLTCSLRGRPLNGKVSKLEDFNVAVVKVPNSACGLSSQGDDDVKEVACHTLAVSDKITTWNYDLSTDNDLVDRGLLYARLAKTAHQLK